MFLLPIAWCCCSGVEHVIDYIYRSLISQRKQCLHCYNLIFYSMSSSLCIFYNIQPLCVFSTPFKPLCVFSTACQPLCVFPTPFKPLCVFSTPFKPLCVFSTACQPLCVFSTAFNLFVYFLIGAWIYRQKEPAYIYT